jgi:outer membrane protein insertion porin family
MVTRCRLEEALGTGPVEQARAVSDGRAVALPPGVRLATASLVGLLACAQTEALPRTPITETCEPNRIGKVDIEGANSADARRALAPIAVLEGTLDNPHRAERVATLATEALRTIGYPRAQIALDRGAGCGVELHAQVTLGPKFRIAKIQFLTDDTFPQKRRLALIEDALGTINTVGGVYVADKLDLALAELQKRYRDAGWARAEIATFAADYDDAKGEVSLTIPIKSGPQFTIGTVRTIGARGFSGEIFDALGLERGQVYEKSALTAGLARARKRIDHHIRMRAVIDDETGTIDVEAIVERR